jgi:hypothetical protein
VTCFGAMADVFAYGADCWQIRLIGDRKMFKIIFCSCHWMDEGGPMPCAPARKQQTRERIVAAAARLFVGRYAPTFCRPYTRGADRQLGAKTGRHASTARRQYACSSVILSRWPPAGAWAALREACAALRFSRCLTSFSSGWHRGSHACRSRHRSAGECHRLW